MISFVMAVHIVSEANARHHWRVKAKRVKLQREATFYSLKPFEKPDADAYTVTLTRIGPRSLDDDNLAGGFKAVRDEVAKWVGIDDGDQRIKFEYAQRRGAPNQYAAEVRIEWK